MFCPFLIVANCMLGKSEDIEVGCHKDCALWNERFGVCTLAVDAYLKGQEDWCKEQETIRKGD